jgi:hypothetical protein
MAFNGTLVSVDGWDIPYKFMSPESYKVTPNQRMESSAKRVTTGVLHRTTCSHTASKIEFNTPALWNADADTLMSNLRNRWSNTSQRKCEVTYFDPETNSHKTGTFYMPDIDFTIMKVDLVHNRILYAPLRICFIEY